MPILNIAAYKFVDLEDLPALQTHLRERTLALHLRGTILIAPEGINLFLAGEIEYVESFLAQLKEDARLADLVVKRSYSAERPFNRMLVKIKREIIPMHQPQIRPAQRPAPRLPPSELKRWLDERRDIVLLDTRNRFEVELGTFRGARDCALHSFSDFPAVVQNHASEWRDKTIVTFCTGGIRCEKAAPYMLESGFKDVYQLDGGILKYFEDCGDAHFQGECFVFDKRVALNPNLQETGTTQCYVCQEVLTLEHQQSPKYVLGRSCPHCAERQADPLCTATDRVKDPA